MLVIEKKPTATLDKVVLCKPINNPVIIYMVNSPKMNKYVNQNTL